MHLLFVVGFFGVGAIALVDALSFWIRPCRDAMMFSRIALYFSYRPWGETVPRLGGCVCAFLAPRVRIVHVSTRPKVFALVSAHLGSRPAYGASICLSVARFGFVVACGSM